MPKYFKIVLLLTVFNFLNADNHGFTEKVLYLENHDPSVVIIKRLNGEEEIDVSFEDSDISWEMLDGWKKDKKLNFEFSSKNGGYLIDPETNKKLLIVGGYKTHPIEEIHQTCLDDPNNFSTAHMVECNYQAYENWDNYLNYIYKNLNSQLTKEQKNSLIKSQRAWIKFKDAQANSMFNILDSKDGTIWRIIISSNTVEIVKSQALRLESYLHQLSAF